MSATSIAARAAAAILTDERGRRAAGWVLAAVLAQFFLLVAFLCAMGSGGAEHNNTAVKACFYGGVFSEQIPDEYKGHIHEMQDAFATLDAEITEVNENAEDVGVDAVRVKSVFFALCFGEDAPSSRAAEAFVGCFYTVETRTREEEVTAEETGESTTVEEEYEVNVPVSLDTAYANVAALLEREITEEDRDNVSHIYSMIAGTEGGVGSGVPSSGSYERGLGNSTALDVPLDDPDTKNAADLVNYAMYAWHNGWGYCWGTIGYVMTPEFLESKAAQYPEGVGDKKDIIASLWMGRRTTDCVGLIKSYGWYDPESQSIVYGSNGMLDYSANQMYYSASESGPIDTIPEIPGLAVWHDGHIGVYIGGGEVIEAMGTNYGVVKTKLADRYFTHWLKVAFISYD